MSDQGNVICNISVSMDRMFYCTCSNTEVYCILRCVIIHQCVDDSTYKCISPSHSVQNVESQTSAFIDFSIFPQISRKTVFTAAVCKSHMSRNAFDIWISLHKGFKYFFLFFIHSWVGKEHRPSHLRLHDPLHFSRYDKVLFQKEHPHMADRVYRNLWLLPNSIRCF